MFGFSVALDAENKENLREAELMNHVERQLKWDVTSYIDECPKKLLFLFILEYWQ